MLLIWNILSCYNLESWGYLWSCCEFQVGHKSSGTILPLGAAIFVALFRAGGVGKISSSSKQPWFYPPDLDMVPEEESKIDSFV